MNIYIMMPILSVALFISETSLAQNVSRSDEVINLSTAEGEEIYSAICSSCHMPDGQGSRGAGQYPALTGNDTLETPEYLIYLIINGFKAMPPLGEVLDDEQITAVVNYIRSNLGNNYEGKITQDVVANIRER